MEEKAWPQEGKAAGQVESTGSRERIAGIQGAFSFLFSKGPSPGE